MAKKHHTGYTLLTQTGDDETEGFTQEHVDYDNTGFKLGQTIGLNTGISLIVGVIIGSGIFVSPKGVVLHVHSVGASLVVWAVSGVISFIGSICYSELGTSIVRSGGDYAYIMEGIGFFPAFLFVWVNTVITRPMAIAVASLIFANYLLKPLFPICHPPEDLVFLIACLAVGLLIFVNCASIRLANIVQNAFTIAKLLALVIVIVVGVVQLCKGKTDNFKNAFEGSATEPGAYALAFYSGLYSYSGWSYLNYVTEELKDPYKNLPRAIYISLPLVTGIYILANIAYFAVLTPEELLASNAVAVTFGDRMLGVMNWCIPLFVAASTFGSCNATILASSRLCFVGARNGHLPEMLAQINVKLMTPINALLFEGLMSVFLLLSNDVYMLINIGVFVETFFMALSVCSLLYLRYKRPDMERPIKVNLFFPIAFLGIVIFLLVMPLFYSPFDLVIGIIATLTGIPVYLIGVKWTRKPKVFQNFIVSMTRWLQKLLYTVKEENKFD